MSTLSAHQPAVAKVSRNSHGQFTNVTTSVSGAVASLVDTKKSAKSDDLVDLKIRNPLHRLFEILQQIKDHQATTFTLRFTIPLIALPIFLFGAFQMGRAQIACVPQFSSKIGIIKELSVLAPKNSPGLWGTLFSAFPVLPKVEAGSELVPQTRSMLITATGETITIVHSASLNLSSWDNKSVILTGNLSVCTNSITLDSLQNLAEFK